MNGDESEIRKENQLLSKIVDSSYDGLFITDAEGKILYCNDSYLRISGLSREKIMNCNICELVNSREIPDACSHEVIRTQKPLTKVIDYYHGVSALVTSIPVFDDAGCLTRVLSNVRDITELTTIKDQLTRSRSLNEEYLQQLRQMEAIQNSNFIAVNPIMQNLLKLGARVANVSSPVLITGESGVGKDMLARYIHDCGGNKESRPFVQINCSAIPESLLESELFGYEPGAFTGAARKGKSGLFEIANNGTLFLDEVGDMPLSLQVKLLNVLQTNKIYRLGGTKTVECCPRIIAATNSNLEGLMNEGRFRRDLYYRLNVIPVYIPPLRERSEDLIPLLLYFIQRKNHKFNYHKRLTPQAIDILAKYSWPGNVRELRNVIENLIVLSEGEYIDEKAIPSHIVNAAAKPLYIDTPDYFTSFCLKKIISEVEREVIRKAIQEFGSLRNVAEHLEIDLSTLVRKKRKYSI